MKTAFSILLLAGIICGCGKPDPRIAKYEQRITALESNVTELYARNENRRTVEKGLAESQAAFLELERTNLAALKNMNVDVLWHSLQIGVLEASVSNLVAQPRGAVRPVQNYYRPASPGVMPAAVAAQIRADAEREWPNQFDMQVYEIKKQTEAWYKLHQ